MDHILYHIFKILLIYHQKTSCNKINVNQIENTKCNRKIKIRYYLKLLTPETVKLLGSTKSKITKDENGEIVPHLEITEVVLVHCNIINNDHQQGSRVLYIFVSNKSVGQFFYSKQNC